MISEFDDDEDDDGLHVTLRDESVTDEVCLEVDQIFIYAPVKTNLTVIQQIFLVSWNKNKNCGFILRSRIRFGNRRAS